MSSDTIAAADMVSERLDPGSADLLANAEFLPRYRALLHEHLPAELKGFATFFSNLNRLATMTSLLERHVGASSLTILNAGSGPFAAEIFSVAFQNRQISAFDYTKGFGDLYPVFRSEGLLTTTHFEQGDANKIDYPVGSFDVIVFHDIFYETALNIPDVLARFSGFLKPGGHVYLDFMNHKTGWLWRLLGKERQYKRYTIEQIQSALRDNGFDLIEMRRSVGTSSRLVKTLSAVLWTLFGTANAYGLIARMRQASEV